MLDDPLSRTPEYKSGMAKALRLLSRRNHTRHELSQKLMQRGVEPDWVQKILDECVRLDYVNDENTAQIYYQELKSKGCGPARVRFQMKKRGLSEALIERQVSDYDPDEELTSARKCLEKKASHWARETDPRKRKDKMRRFLYARGFSGDVISRLTAETDRTPA
jgi:regulatory protein